MGKELWCEHIHKIWIDNDADNNPILAFYMWYGETRVEKDWKQCPICSAPRPSEPKKLYEIVSESGSKGYASAEQRCKAIASAVTDHVLGVVESIKPHQQTYMSCDDFKSSLIKKLKEEGEG